MEIAAFVILKQF